MLPCWKESFDSPPASSHSLVNKSYVFISICMRKAETANWIRLPKLFFSFATIRYMGCLCEKNALNHSIYHDLGNENIQQADIPVIIKPVTHGLYMKHISFFSWGFPLGIYRGRQKVPLLRINRPYSGFSPVQQAGCFLGNNLLCV